MHASCHIHRPGHVQGLQEMYKFEKDAVGAADLRLSDQALDVLAQCVDTFGRCLAHRSALTKQMAVLEPINDHAFSLPVRRPVPHPDATNKTARLGCDARTEHARLRVDAHAAGVSAVP